MKYTYYLTMSLILLSGCHNFISKDGNENQDTFTIDGREYALDTLLISQISSIEDEAVYFNIENLIGTFDRRKIC